MSPFGLFAGLVLAAIMARWLAQLWLEHLNRKHVLAHASRVPAAFEKIIDAPTYARSVEYTLAKGVFHRFELTYDAVVLVAVLFSGILPWAFGGFHERFGAGVWA